MKTKNPIGTDAELLQIAASLLQADLSDPVAERSARFVLKDIRKRGYKPLPTDLDDPECLMCLHMALLSTLDLSAADRFGKSAGECVH